MRRELLFCAVAILCRLALTADLPSTRLDLRVDDGLYVRTADHLLAGEWQGPYDRYTLAKSIGYPAFLAGARRVGMPARLAEELLLCAAMLALWGALRALGVGPLTAGAALVLGLFSPANLSPALNRVSRESIYTAQVVLVFASALTLAARIGPVRRAAVAVALALVTAWTWHTREEGVWLVPPLAAAAIGVWWLRRDRARPSRATAEVIAIAGLVIVAVIAASTYIERSNRRHYGAGVLVELADDDFEAAIGAIERVTPLRELPFGARTEEDFARLYEVSPAMATLRSHIDGPALRADFMLARGHRIHNFQTWAIREAAAVAGHHETLPRAKAFYRRVAEEINAACDDGRLPAGARRSRVVPLPGWKDRGAALDAIVEGGRALATARILPGGAGITLPTSQVTGEEARRFRLTLGEPPAPDLSSFFVRRTLFHRIERVYEVITPWLGAAGLLAFLASLVVLRGRALTPAVIAAGVLLIAAATRLAMLACLKAVYFPFAFNYLLASHVLVIVAVTVLAGVALERLLRGRLPEAPARLALRLTGLVATLALPVALLVQAGLVWPRAPWTAPAAWTAGITDGCERIVLSSPHYRFDRTPDGRLRALRRSAADDAPMRTVDAWIMTPRLGSPHDVVVSGRVVTPLGVEPVEGVDVVVIWEGRGKGSGPKGGDALKSAADGTFSFWLDTRLTTAERITVGLVEARDASLELERIDLVPSR